MGQATFTSSGTGNWSASGTWSRSGSDADGVPDGDDNVIIISTHNVTATASATCAVLTFNSTTDSPTLTVNTGIVVTVSGAINVLNTAGSNTYALITGLGSVSCASIVVGGNVTTLSADATTRLDLTVSSISVSGDVNLFGEDDGNDDNDCIFRISSGQLSVAGQIITDEENGSNVNITMNAGSQNGTLVLTNTAPFLNSVGTLGYNFYGTSNTVNYASTSSQTVAVTTYRNLTISGGGAKTASNNVTVNGTLTLTNGILTFTGGQLRVSNTGSVTGASNASHINGQVRKTGSTLFVFPVGKSGRYAPIEVSSISTSVDITAEYLRADPGTGGLPLAGGASNPNVESVSRSEYWSLLSNNSAATCSVKLSLDAGSLNSSTPNLLRLVRTTNTTTSPITWTSFVSQANTTNTGTSSSGSITAASVSLGTTAFYTTFGSTTANAFIGLPVKYGTIKATEKGRGVQIDWTSYDEHYLANYQIERSADGIHFTSIGDVAPRNVTAETQYGFFDALPLSGTSFYRIRNIDLDSKSGLSNIVKINLNKNVKTISIYPNPMRGNRVSFQTSDLAQGTYNVELINAVGMRVFAQSISHAGGAINQGLSLPSNLKSGQYTLRINGNTTNSNHQLIILQ